MISQLLLVRLSFGLTFNIDKNKIIIYRSFLRVFRSKVNRLDAILKNVHIPQYLHRFHELEIVHGKQNRIVSLNLFVDLQMTKQ